MIHLAFPSVAENHHWFEERISIYVEPVARAQVGQFPPAEVLQSLYKEMRNKPAPVHLDQIWQKLGVALKNGEVAFNDHAVDAATRRAIVSPPH